MPPNFEICLVATAELRVFDAKFIREIISSDYPRSETMCPLASHFMLKFIGSRSMQGCHFHVIVASSGECHASLKGRLCLDLYENWVNSTTVTTMQQSP